MDVSSLISSASDRAATLASQADRVLSDAMGRTGILTGIGNLPTLDMSGDWSIELPEAPVLEPLRVPDDRVAPEMPELADVTTPAEVLIPDAPTIDVTVVAPSRPSELEAFTKSAPELALKVNLPAAPDPFIREAPDMADIVMPDRPQIQRYTFTGVRPAGMADAPDVVTAFETAWRTMSPSMQSAISADVDAFISQYNPRFHDQMSLLEQRLAGMVQGGTGLRPEVEDAIYERSRAKASAEARRLQESAWDTAARRGFTLPTGVLMSAQQQARQAAADLHAAGSREIVVMQAELEQRNVQFAITTSAGLRQTVLNAAVSMHGNLIQLNGQAIQYANSMVDALVKLYNLEVQKFQAQLEQYRADAQVFETLIRSSQVDIQLYQAEIDAERAKAQVDGIRPANPY